MNIQIVKEDFLSEISDLMFALDLHYSEKSSNLQEKRKRAKTFIHKKQVYGYFLKERFVGYLLIEYFDENHKNLPGSIFLSELFVLEEFRRKDIGSDLVKHVLKLNLSKNYRYFSLTYTSKERYLKEFYEKLGFKFDRVLESGNVAMIKERELLF